MALTRRQFLMAGTFSIAAAALPSAPLSAAMPSHTLRVALLHLAPRPGDLAYNRQLVETAVTRAAGTRRRVDPHARTLYLWLCLCRRDRHRLDCATTRPVDARLLPAGGALARHCLFIPS